MHIIALFNRRKVTMTFMCA